MLLLSSLLLPQRQPAYLLYLLLALLCPYLLALQMSAWSIIGLICYFHFPRQYINIFFFFWDSDTNILMYIYLSVGFYQMSKIAVTPSIVLAEFILYKKKVSIFKVTVFFFSPGDVRVTIYVWNVHFIS